MQAHLGLIVRITLKAAGTYSNVSDISSDILRNLSPPHSGKVVGAGNIFSSLGISSSNLRRFGRCFTIAAPSAPTSASAFVSSADSTKPSQIIFSSISFLFFAVSFESPHALSCLILTALLP